MRITAGDIGKAIEQWAPTGWAYDWDRVGLSIGQPGQEVSKVLVCLTVCREAFQAAKKAGAQMIVSHHPLIFRPLDALRTDVPHVRLCLDIAGADMACYAAHTNLDVAPHGVNHVLAELLGLQKTQPLFKAGAGAQVKLVTFVPETHLAPLRKAVCGAGAGDIGDYSCCTFSTSGRGTFKPGSNANPFIGTRGTLSEEPELRFEVIVPKARLKPVLATLFKAHPYEEVAYDLIPLENRDVAVGLGVRGVLPEAMPLKAFDALVRERLGLAHTRMVTGRRKKVSTVAVLGGSGGSEASKVPFDVDCLVTGDVKYHEALDARDRGLSIIDAGHAGTEQPIVPALANYLRKHVNGLKVSTFIEEEVFDVSG